MIRSSRIGLAHATLALFAVAILGKAADVQLVHGAAWRARAARQQSTERTVPAPRGEILDATRRVLAQSREMVRLEIAPREVDEPRRLRRALAALHIAPSLIARALDRTGRYLVVPGDFLAVDAAPAIALHGVHSFATIQRAYAASDGSQALVGHVDASNHALDGIELSLDAVLRGTPGRATIFNDSHGRSRESPIAPGTPPARGDDVVLTIHEDLQEIAERALADAVATMGAEGGDIVILDPRTGEILAMASRRSNGTAAVSALSEPFEPGSTAKPFIAAGLLERGLVRPTDSVDTGNGVYEINGRAIHDEHLIGRAPLADVLRWSSNIGIVKFAQRLTPRQEYETLRDFGFGMPTGVDYPTESSGSLRAPPQWSTQSANSMAMGYELAVTPLQLAAAYATFANGGKLIEPALVKEIVRPDGAVRYRHEPRVIRQVMPAAVADRVRHMLLDVVDDGTALQAALDNYLLAGKTGTPRGTVRGRYVVGRYNPNFVGLFPGDAPQYVIVVKLTAPQSSIFAAKTAAPVTKAILQAAIAARDAALDRGKLASSIAVARAESTHQHVAQAVHATADIAPRALQEPSDTATRSDPGHHALAEYVVTLPMRPQAHVAAPSRPVPDVHGLGIRDAVRSLHSAGFRVQLAREPTPPESAADAVTTQPAPGSVASSGTLVRLYIDY